MPKNNKHKLNDEYESLEMTVKAEGADMKMF